MIKIERKSPKRNSKRKMNKEEKLHKFKKVEVHWGDSCLDKGWNNESEMVYFCSKSPSQCFTAGYLIEENDQWIVVCLSYSATTKEYMSMLKIPKRDIVFIKNK